MREGLVSRLEQLSVYQHSQNGVNSMVLSHRIISLRGTIFHVLTRTVDAGLDYTNRTNFIAHHVVFQPHELHGACSPADFILYWPGWLSGWEGDPGWTDDQAASLHGVQNTTSLPAENWAGWSGHAGNASLLLESGKARDVALVAEPGQESALVYLFAESLLLLNEDRNGKGSQWQIPFTTFFQSKDEVADFRWRGVWPEVNRTKAERGALVLDLRNPSSFPVTTGPLAEWASTGIAPKPVLSPEIAPAAETQPAETEEIAAVSVPKSRQPRTDTVSQVSRKKRQPEYIAEEREEDWQSWFWKWKLVILAGLAVIALAAGMGVSMLVTMLNRPNQDSGIILSGPDLSQRQIPSTNMANSVPGKNTTSNPFQSPLSDKSSTPTNSLSNLAPLPANSTSSSVVVKSPSNVETKTNAPPIVPVLPVLRDETAASISHALDTLPQGEVFLILKDQSNLDTTPLPNDLTTKLVAWKDACHYSISTSGFSPTGTSKPVSSQDQFVLSVSRDRHAYYSTQGIRIENQGIDETFYICFTNGAVTISVIIVNPSNAAKMYHLSKSLVQLGADNVSINKSLADYFSKWHIYDPNLKPLQLRLQMAPNKGVHSDAFTISWKDSLADAQTDLAKQNAREQNDEKNIKIKKEIDAISFSDVPPPLIVDDKVKTMLNFITGGTANSNPKYPLLVVYANELLKSLSTQHGDFRSNHNLPTTTDAAAVKTWLSDVSSAIQKDLEAQGAGFPEEDSSKLKTSIDTLCSDWKKHFVDSPNLADLLKITADSVDSVINAANDLATVNQQIEKDKAAAQPILPGDIQSVAIVMASQDTDPGTPLVLFDDGTANYAQVAPPINGGGK